MQHEKLSSTVRTATQVVHRHRTSYRSGWPVAFLAPTYLLPRLYGPNTSSHRKEVWQKPIRCVTIYLQDRPGAASLRTRIVPKSPFLFVKRSSTRYNVRVDAGAIRHSVNKPCCSWINSVIQVLSNMALQLNLVNRFKGAVSRQSSSFFLILQITRLQSLWNLK